MKKIDIYIIKKFLGTFFLAISLLVIVVIIFDVSEKIDDFIEREAPLKEIIFSYYLNFIPYFLNLFSPLFTFIAVVFFTSKIASNSEIIAILSSGISFKRLLVPYFISSLILVLMSFYLSNFLIPDANKKRLEFEKEYIKCPTGSWIRNIHLQTESGIYVYVESFNSETNTGYNFTYEKIADNSLIYKLNSDFIKWDSVAGKWELENYNVRFIDGMEEKVISKRYKDTVITNLKPIDFKTGKIKVATMNFSQLRKFINKERIKGSDRVIFYEVEKYKRLIEPLSMLIFTLLGVTLSSHKVRGGIGTHLGLGLSISFAYILFMQISTTFSNYGNLPPYLGVWIPNILFGILGLYLLKIAPK